MPAEILKFAIPAVIILILVAVAIYFIIRFMRGSIKIELPQNSFNESQQISGSFELVTRKQIAGNRLYAAIVGKEVIRERYGGKTRTRTREIYRYEQTLEEAKTYPAGQAMKYDFQLPAPSINQNGFGDSALGQTLKAGMEILSGSRRYMKWQVQIRLDAKGIDLASNKKVNINM